jgi:glycosyltransferase involved in cell wall biosynthesis
MKVTHLSTGSIGGAGLAASRASDSLVSIGIDSTFYSPVRDITFPRADGISNIHLIKSKFVTFAQRKLVQKTTNFVSPLSVGILPIDFSRDEVLHIHAFYNLFSTENLLALAAERPLYFTLHDERLLTGGCHYTNECLGYMSNCSNCPQVSWLAKEIVRREKERINELLLHPQVHLIFPSKWLLSRAQEILSDSKNRMSVVHNPIPRTSLVADRKKLREDLGVLPTTELVGFVSKDLFNPLKGLNDLVSALNTLPVRRKINLKLLLVGQGTVPASIADVDVIHIVPKTSLEISNLMRSMDVLVVPSHQDNSPNVVGESLMAGTPVIGSRIGGIPEIIEKLGLPTFEVGNLKGIASILNGKDFTISRTDLVSKSEEIFGYSVVASKLKEIYCHQPPKL